ncbi:hypothetical protein J7355_16775 [Endozoicomonas sp. G2_2]|uniref:hypothetical protein n=1 Tax=Endozoicomonas sp. G2_2 TaxID=2821092 RepID=UPI001ADA031A|nr:hypothetical protein [Endozoicomonas sp. G2_2]MBO9471747.1 hypothetical protein [Endozoicomonas sp. G2_2]
MNPSDSFGVTNSSFDNVLEAAEWMNALEPQVVSAQQEYVANSDSWAKAKADKKRKADAVAKRNFERASSAPLSVGDRVCTWGNYVGTVEQIGSDNVKVAFIGRIRSRAPKGALFNPQYSNFTITSNPELEWLRKDQVGVCDIYR